MLAADMPGDLLLLFCLNAEVFFFFSFFFFLFLMSWMPKPEHVGEGGHSRQSPQTTFYMYKSPLSGFPPIVKEEDLFFVVVEKTGK